MRSGSAEQIQRPDSLTIAILAFNEEDSIADCLASAHFADQILVIDSGSNDSTIAIAKAAGAEVEIYPNWQGFAVQRNRAIMHCRSSYVFFLDCDEIISAALAHEILAATEEGTANRGLIRWDDYVFGKRLKGLHQTKGIPRLFKVADLDQFEGQVHENARLINPQKNILFQSKLTHHSRRSIHKSLLKLAQYSQLAAIRLRASRKRAGVFAGLIHALPRFLNLYFLKLSFLSGGEGFLYSLLISLEVFFKYCSAYYDKDADSITPARR